MVLTVHFKRFTASGKKINDTVQYPERLQLGPYMSNVSAWLLSRSIHTR